MIKTKNTEDKFSEDLTVKSLVMQEMAKFVTKLPFYFSQRQYNLTVSDSQKFVWFRVAKVCTRSILATFKDHEVGLVSEHASKCHYSPSLYLDYFKFAFVRNPYSRLVSCWQNKVIKCNGLNLSEKLYAEVQSFSTFVEYVESLDIQTCNRHICLQSSLIDVNNIDFIGRFENFNQDFRFVCGRIGIKLTEVAHKNQTRNHQDIDRLYTPDLVRRVAEIYGKDFMLFYPGYDFYGNRGVV